MGTAAIVAIAILVMMATHLPLSQAMVAANAERGVDMVIEEEEFIEVIPESPEPISDPAPIEDAPTRATATEQAPSQPKPENGPAVDTKKLEEDAIKREANEEISNAFSKTGKHNNSTSNTDQGNNGSPDGNAQLGSLTGTGTGTVGGGWGMPNYSPVMSTVTGSVKMILTIDKEGNVTNVAFDGGNPPAATNTAVRQACAAEVRRHRFTRSNPDTAPATSKAYITYTFK